jgi:hypothetical protein
LDINASLSWHLSRLSHHPSNSGTQERPLCSFVPFALCSTLGDFTVKWKMYILKTAIYISFGLLVLAGLDNHINAGSKEKAAKIAIAKRKKLESERDAKWAIIEAAERERQQEAGDRQRDKEAEEARHQKEVIQHCDSLIQEGKMQAETVEEQEWLAGDVEGGGMNTILYTRKFYYLSVDGKKLNEEPLCRHQWRYH